VIISTQVVSALEREVGGTFTAPPTLLLDVRNEHGAVVLPPAPDWRTGD
jgi:hypothetical protein